MTSLIAHNHRSTKAVKHSKTGAEITVASVRNKLATDDAALAHTTYELWQATRFGGIGWGVAMYDEAFFTKCAEHYAKHKKLTPTMMKKLRKVNHGGTVSRVGIYAIQVLAMLRNLHQPEVAEAMAARQVRRARIATHGRPVRATAARTTTLFDDEMLEAMRVAA